MASFGLKDIEDLLARAERSVTTGQAYRVSKRQSLDDGQELIVHFDPQESGGTIHIEPPSLLPEGVADVDVYENADPGTNTTDDMVVHNMRYDSGSGTEQPKASILRVSDGGLNTTAADKTEESRAAADVTWNAPQGAPARALWRTIPTTENVSIVITDDSGGANNVLAFDTVVYEGDIYPD